MKIGNKTTDIYEQNAACNGFYIVSEISDTSQSAYYESNQEYDNTDWFVEEILKLENKMTICF